MVSYGVPYIKEKLQKIKVYSCFAFLLKLLLLSNCRSNPTLSHSFSGTKHGVLPGHPDTTEVPNQGIINNDEQLLIPPNSQGIAIGKQPLIGNMRPKKNKEMHLESVESVCPFMKKQQAI